MSEDYSRNICKICDTTTVHEDGTCMRCGCDRYQLYHATDGEIEDIKYIVLENEK